MPIENTYIARVTDGLILVRNNIEAVSYCPSSSSACTLHITILYIVCCRAVITTKRTALLIFTCSYLTRAYNCCYVYTYYVYMCV